MPFKLLKQVITYLKKKIKCPACSGGVNEDSISVVATMPPMPGTGSSGVFSVECSKCDSQAFVLIEVTNITDKIKKSLNSRSKIAGKITMNEVLDMHNFLKTWKGSVKELFKETQ